MPRATTLQSINREQWRYYSTHNLASTVSFGMQASVNDSDHGRVVRIFVGPS